MAKTRLSIPKVVKDGVLKEYNHRCAKCGADRPQVHHIDENPSNNDPLNLMPLCPNCHLTDQHDATNSIPVAKLAFFRRHKHRLILRPQFKAIFRRMEFLQSIRDSDTVDELERKCKELTALIVEFPMGHFFASELHKLFELPAGPVLVSLDRIGSKDYADEQREHAEQYRAQLRAAVPKVEELIIELLDHQDWPEEDHHHPARR